jgi:RimJ/RimL family protein N-acetyltransferase
MDITFRKATKADQKLIKGWLDKPHVKEHWDDRKEIVEHLENPQFHYWICLSDQKPFGLIITSDASQPDPATQEVFDHIVPWIEPEGKTLIIYILIGEKAFLDRGLSSESLTMFAKAQGASVSAFLADPEVKNEKALHIYEKVGFVKVSTFIRGKGFFRGNPHYLLKLKITH